MKILLIEDNIKLNEAVRTYLVDSGFDVEVAFNGVQGVNKIKDDKKENILYDIVILDRVMPMKDGIEVVKEIKDLSQMTGIIMLTAKDTVEDKVAGLSAGADDYMIKPFDVKELIARIHALYRRNQIILHSQNDFSSNGKVLIRGNSININEAETFLKGREVTFDFDNHKIFLKDKTVNLTQKEMGIFKLLLENLNMPVSKEIILETVWGSEIDSKEISSRFVDVHVHNLRNKLSEEYFPGIIETIRGGGYKLLFS